MADHSAAAVVIIADEKDAHALAVDRFLRERGIRSAFCSPATFGAYEIEWLAAPNGRQTIGGIPLNKKVTIWLRRLPSYQPSSVAAKDERQLLRDEVREAFLGTLLASKARWVDHPSKVSLAENRIIHSEVARRCGFRVPAFILTSRVDKARQFARKPSVVKALSSGPGPAPSVDLVDDSLLDRVKEGPIFLQEFVPALADARVVTVGGYTFCWERRRDRLSSVDWRVDDPRGGGFRPVRADDLVERAHVLSRRLGLQFSVQDWLLTSDGPVFLEVNPQGEWLFLEGADGQVASAMASLLDGSHESSRGGLFPSPWRRFYWDLLPSRVVPADDGLAPPHLPDASWLDSHSKESEIHVLAREARQRAEERAATPLEKASRLVSLSLTLLTLSLALAGYQLDLLQSASPWWWFSVMPTASAVLSFMAAIVLAIDVDRPGLQSSLSIRKLVESGAQWQLARLRMEEQAREIASWTAHHRYTTFLRARSWFSRGLIFILAAAIAVLVLRLV